MSAVSFSDFSDHFSEGLYWFRMIYRFLFLWLIVTHMHGIVVTFAVNVSVWKVR